MEIYIDKKKIRKRIISFSFTTIALLIGLTMLIITAVSKHKFFDIRIVTVICALGAFLYFWLRATLFYWKLARSNSWIVRYKDGKFDNVSKFLNKAKELKIEDMVSVNFWSLNKGITQYKIVTTKHDPSRNALMNQLKGNDIYLSDYIVDSRQLFNLMEKIGKDCQQNNKQNLPENL